ncbi:hypothetical protein EJB05_07546, partial [Eragrostis curvula]
MGSKEDAEVDDATREAEDLGSSPRKADSATGCRRSPPGGMLMFPCPAAGSPLQRPAVRGFPLIG